MTLRTVTSPNILDLHGAARAGDTVVFRLLDGTYSATEHVPPDSQSVTIASDGSISVVLYCPAKYQCIIAGTMRFPFVLPDDPTTPITLEALHAASAAASLPSSSLQTIIDTVLVRANNLSDLASATTARTNLGIYGTGEYNVKAYGAIGNGTTDDTAAIQSALDSVPAGSTVVIPRDMTCKLTGAGLTISKKIRLTGGGTLQLTGANTNAIICNLSGTIDGLEIDNLTLSGDALAVGSQAGIGCFSGQTISNPYFHDLTVTHLNIGISCNADLGGSFTNATVARNTLSAITGLVSGSGYGIHLANAFGALVIGNHITGVERHSIYQAKGGQSIIIGNTIRDHRKTSAALLFRAACFVSRSSNVLVANNRFIDGYDCSIMLAEDSAAYDCKDITIIGNQISNRQNNVYDIIVGQEIIPATYRTTNVTIQGNRITADATISGANSSIMVLQGRKIRIQANDIHRTNVDGTNDRLMAIAHASYTAVDADCTETVISGNSLIAEGPNTVGTSGILFGTVICGGASVHSAPLNSFVGITTPYSYLATLTNPNLIAGVDWSGLVGSTATMQAISGDANLNIKFPHVPAGTGANGNVNFYAGTIVGGQLVLKTSPNAGSRYFGLVGGSDVDGNRLPLRVFMRDVSGTGVNALWLGVGLAAGWVALGPGSVAGPSSPVQAMGAIATPVAAKAAAYTIVATDSVVTGDTTSAPFTLTLPTAIAATGRHYTIKRLNAGANTLTVACASTQTIDGATTQTLTSQWQTLRIVSDGANWLSV